MFPSMSPKNSSERSSERSDRRSLRDCSGLTLIELMVASGLLLVLGSLVIGLILSFANIQNAVQTRFDSSVQGQTIIQQLVRQLKTAAIPSGATSPFVDVSPSSVTFYASESSLSAPNEIRIQALPDVGSQCPCSITETNLTSSPPVVSLRLAGLNSLSVFNFYPAPSATSLDPGALLVSPSGTTSSATLNEIYGVGVRLSILTSLQGNPVSLSNFVELPNVYFH